MPDRRAEFLTQRRAALIIAADREFRGSKEPIPALPACPGIYTPPVDGRNERLAMMEAHRREAHLDRVCQPIRVGHSKSPRERLHTMTEKCHTLLGAMERAVTREEFMRLRQQFHSLRCEAKRFCTSWALPLPKLPVVPANHFGDLRFKANRETA